MIPNRTLNIDQLSFWERKSFFEEIDFVVIGAGIVGSSSALHLKKKYPNAKIVLLERGYLPSGASTKNAGFACFGSPTELIDDLTKMDESTVFSTIEKRWKGLQSLRSIIGDVALDFQQNGSWEIIHSKDKSSIPSIDEKIPLLNKYLHEITGVNTVFSKDDKAAQKFGFQHIETCFHNQLEAQIDTGKLMIRYQQLLAQAGIIQLNGINVLKINSNGTLIETSIGEIQTKNTLITVNGFASQFVEEDVAPARAQVVVTSKIENLKFKGTFHFDEGYYYFRNFESRVLLGGGRNLDILGETTTDLNTTEKLMDKLKELLNTLILPETNFTIDYQWAGIMGIGKTKAPIIKKIAPSLGIGVRLGGMGVAIGTDVGRELAELF